jgi:hypothetical protein
MNLSVTDTDTNEYYVWEVKIIDGTKLLSSEQGDLIIDQNITKTV